jgi:asparagine synthase (glutamine-hydrolysing)
MPTAAEMKDLAGAMSLRLTHRGPDAGGSWAADGEPVVLSHRRLSILDLTVEGNQPMASHCGRYVIAYNGEVFNFPELKAAVEQANGPVAWRGHSDTEILLQAIAAFGVDGATSRAQGMFAFAVWDRRERVLHLARDRLGKKPLYFAWAGSDLVFGSEVRALAAHPRCPLAPDRSALLGFLRRGYVVAPRSGYAGIFKLEPGAILSVTEQDIRRRVLPEPRRFWHSTSVRSLADQQPTSSADVGAMLSTAVAARMVADVPVGAFLSGGVDSTLVVALMTRIGGQGVKTFTVGFADGGHSEAEQAAAVARHLGTQHHEIILGAHEAANLVPVVVGAFDEPFGDFSAVPTWLVSQLAARTVKVVLSGDGADELFGGYTRYADNARIWRWRRHLPGSIAAAAVGLAAGSLSTPDAGRVRSLLAAALAGGAGEFYRIRTSQVLDPCALMSGAEEYPMAGLPTAPLRGSIEREMMYLDLVTYLPDDILAKVDRASMAHSLEVRSPFLDERLVDYAWSLPDEEVTGVRGGKALLRDLLYGLVPRPLVDRPKAGFGPQLDVWLAGPLREWTRHQLLESPRLAGAGFDVRAIRRLWDGFVAGRRRLAGAAWNLAVLSVWLARQQDRTAG